MAGLTAKEDFHRSLLQDDKVMNGRDELSSIQQNDPRIGFASPDHDLSSVNSGKLIILLKDCFAFIMCKLDKIDYSILYHVEIF